MSRNIPQNILKVLNELSVSRLAADWLVAFSMELNLRVWKRCFVSLVQMDIFGKNDTVPTDWADRLALEISKVSGAKGALLREVNAEITKHNIAAGDWDAIIRADCQCSEKEFAEQIKGWLLGMK